ncbi:MAG: alpha/beta hydrolase [Candidatus Nitrosocosmicus sp.]|nr:alpha/beta hydrolase [Candidatus Nitrosocosmicus sp.]MDN5867290.1 alpha/beta hydrolase [Candidatus Nitrosocosmicus sp.]
MKRLTFTAVVFCFSFVLFFYGGFLNSVFAQKDSNSSNNSTIFIPITISEGAQNALKNITTHMPEFVTPEPGDLKGWEEMNKQISAMSIAQSQSLVNSFEANITSTKLGEVNVLDIKPENWVDNGKILVYLHGGGYTILGANSTLSNSVPMANATGLRVISIDYSLAPSSKWNEITSEVVSVIKALKDQGYTHDEDIAMYGDSAGGGLVASSVLKMRDEGVGMPAALVLWSPWTDVSGAGDTYSTLKSADPFISESMLKNFSGAYTNISDQKNPYVSPVYGNFSKGFPPTLIQVGTKEMLLSDSVRIYQVLDQDNIPVKLDVYEGMPHVFQTTLYNTPESSLAISKTVEFLKEYLN